MPDRDENKVYGFANLIPQRILSFFPSNRKLEGADNLDSTLVGSLPSISEVPSQTLEETIESLNLFRQPPGAYQNYELLQTYLNQPEASPPRNSSRSRATSNVNTLQSPAREASQTRTSSIIETPEAQEQDQSTQPQRLRTISSVSTSSNLSSLSSLSTTHSLVSDPSRVRTPSIREVVELQERKEPAHSHLAPRPISNVNQLSVSRRADEKPGRNRTPSISLPANDGFMASSSSISQSVSHSPGRGSNDFTLNKSLEDRGKVSKQLSSSKDGLSTSVLLSQSPRIPATKQQSTITGHLRPQTAEESANVKSRDKLSQVLTQLSESVSRVEPDPSLTRNSKARSRKEGPKELWQTIPNEPSSALSRSASRISTNRPSRRGSVVAPDADVRVTADEGSEHGLRDVCDQCQRYSLDQAYCNVCQFTFCTSCWAMQMTHRNNKLAQGNVPHEKTLRELASKIKNILEPDFNGAKEEQLHTEDATTTWFGIYRGEPGELPIFQDYGRYAALMSDTGPQGNSEFHNTRFPGLVSFVGQTGAGKSTLIKLVIDLSNDEAEGTYATPIVGSVKNQDVPTSGDVHLYPDPTSISSVTPILYADCEGLEGGEREPVSSRFKKGKKHRFTGVGRASSFEKKTMKTQHTSEREITWAVTAEKKSREFAVTHLYPRLLYTFSDVVVFVLKNPRTIESVFEKLVDWAAAALEKSSNQPVLPHAIIVLNACENSTEERLWDPEVATYKLFDSLSGTIFKNEKFKKYAKFWRERQRQVDSVEELLLSYYSSVKVVRIPTHGRPNLISEQVRILYKCIQDDCTTARLRKGKLRMLLDADELQPYLQFAFDHFACDLETPFDFVQASFVNSPIPSDFGGNILKLAINMMDVWQNVALGPILFTELSYMVASCIMLDSARHGIKGNADQIFPNYVEHLDAALENFCDRHWPCEYVVPSGGRCVNVRSGHGSKGHQLRSGKVLAVGEYFSTFAFAEYQKKFQYDVFIRLDGLLLLLRDRQVETHKPEVQAAAEIHRDTVLKNFYAHAMRGPHDSYISHTSCFCCLFESPEHSLPCGHVLCTGCLKAFGTTRKRNVMEIDCCPIDGHHFPSGRWTVVLKPDTAGIRILTLDGGGVRGIVELEILRQIETNLNNISIKSFFDLVVGTSTGGIIALGLVANGWSVQECTRSFMELCGKAFTARVGSNIPGVGFLVELHNHSKYEAQPLQEALEDAYGPDYLFGGSRSLRMQTDSPEIKVAVTTTSTAGTPTVLANYNRRPPPPSGDKLPYHFQRPERLSAELKTWEAARATSAAPRIFKPMSHEPSKQVYADGGIYHNNPIMIADQEWKLLWPQLADNHPDIVLSIGTSFNPDAKTREKMQRTSTLSLGALNHAKALLRIAMDHIASTLDSERTWSTYLEILNPPSRYRCRYVRLNPRLDVDPPPLDSVDQMAKIRNITRSIMMKDKMVRNVALQLIATSFYFEKMQQPQSLERGGFEVKGHINCRLIPGSDDIRRLGQHLRFLATKSHPYFLIQEEHRSDSAERVLISLDVMEAMISSKKFRMKPFTAHLTTLGSVTEMFMAFDTERVFHISHFPRALIHDDTYSTGARYTIAANSSRWAGRSHSQRHRITWTPPPTPTSTMDTDVLSTYASPTYVLGNTSPATLQASASRLQKKKIWEMDSEGSNDRGPMNEDEPGVPAVVQSGPAEIYTDPIYEMPG